MNKQYTVSGVGVCLGMQPGCEALAESIITAAPIAGKVLPNALELAVQEAMQFTAVKNIPVLTNCALEPSQLKALNLGAQQVCTGLSQMLQAAQDNALLLQKQENGWLAIALTREDVGYAQVDITEDSAAAEDKDDFLNFLISAMEIRYALRLGKENVRYRFWDSMEPRSKGLSCAGRSLLFTEPKCLATRVYESKKYLLCVVFETVEEATRKLAALKQLARGGMENAMTQQLKTLQQRSKTSNTVVLLAENADALDAEIDAFLRNSARIMEPGFTWKSKNGSCYICRSCAEPKIVFMNSPGGMLNAKSFYNFFFKHYGAIKEASRFQTDRRLTGESDQFLSRTLFETVVNFTVISLLSELGIESDIRSGACQGELSMEFLHMRDKDGTDNVIGKCLEKIAAPLEVAMCGDKKPLEMYLNRQIDKFTKYYLKCPVEKVRAAAQKYDGVFIWIIGSVEDVIVAGEKAACLRLIDELGCLGTEMGDPLYIHTPIMEAYRKEIRQGLLDSGLYFDVDNLPFKLFSTHYLKYMTSEPEMLADNMTELIIGEVDYSKAVQALYQEGGRVFIDLSTMQLCGGWARNTLKNHPDAGVMSIYSGNNGAADLLNFAVTMLAGNVTFDFGKILSKLSFPKDAPVAKTPEQPVAVQQKNEVKPMATQPMPQAAAGDASSALQQYIANQLALNQKAYEMYLEAEEKLFGQIMAAHAGKQPAQVSAAPAVSAAAPKKNYLWDRQQVITMTDTSMAAVLGEKYKEVDQYPIRARMPLPPFLFVSRIVSIDAEFGVMRPSSIVAEYDLDEDCVFRTGDTHVSPLIGSEASHIAIFLIAYMGLDAISKGTLSYRAIDSSQVTYSERPFRVGDTMRTVLKINRFVQNGSTTLLFFSFETYNGDELIAITEATGGFFTKADLSSNKGIISPKKPLTKLAPAEFPHLSDLTATTYGEAQLAAFYKGDYEACFGKIQKPTLKETYYMPHDLKMVDRVTNIDYNGGMYGRGIICGEKQITPDMWPFKAHFKNDPVFPAIIMTDGVTQLGMFLFLHSGLLSKFKNTTVTSIKGHKINSKFRGQARHGYSTLSYEVHIKDVVETENSIAVYFDAKILNDGLQIIQVESYALKIVGEPN